MRGQTPDEVDMLEKNERNKWKRFQLPESLEGKTFLDVGCWEGDYCVEAVRRGASRVVGLDMCTCESLRRNLDEYGFEFVHMDVFSEKFIGLGQFDIVLCSGVLYHVENVLSLLFRLRAKTRELLALETAAHTLMPERPLLLFYPASEDEEWASRWWAPNRLCLQAMLETSGFTDVELVWDHQVKKGQDLERIYVLARPSGEVSATKMHPRRPDFMSIEGGERKAR